MINKVVIFRPGTLGDQLVLLSVLKSLNISKSCDFLLIERCFSNRLSASSFSYFQKFYSQIFSYKNLFSLLIVCLKLRLRYSNIKFIYIPHSARSVRKIIFETLFFSIFLPVKKNNVFTFIRTRNVSKMRVSEYSRVTANISSVLVDTKVKFTSRINNKGKQIVVAPKSAWPSKDWPLLHFQKLFLYLTVKGYKIVIIGTMMDNLEDYLNGLNNDCLESISIVCDRSLEEIESLLTVSKLFIGVDSAMAHLAASCGLPSVVLFSDTNRLEDWQPPHPYVQSIRKTVECGGCFSSICKMRDHTCMDKITLKEVIEAAEEKLSR